MRPSMTPPCTARHLENGVLLHRRETDAGKLWFLENTGAERADVDLSEIAEGLPHHVLRSRRQRSARSSWTGRSAARRWTFTRRSSPAFWKRRTETIIVAYDPDSDPKFAATPGDPVHVRRHQTPEGRTQTFLTLTPGQMDADLVRRRRHCLPRRVLPARDGERRGRRTACRARPTCGSTRPAPGRHCQSPIRPCPPRPSWNTGRAHPPTRKRSRTMTRRAGRRCTTR